MSDVVTTMSAGSRPMDGSRASRASSGRFQPWPLRPDGTDHHIARAPIGGARATFAILNVGARGGGAGRGDAGIAGDQVHGSADMTGLNEETDQ